MIPRDAPHRSSGARCGVRGAFAPVATRNTSALDGLMETTTRVLGAVYGPDRTSLPSAVLVLLVGRVSSLLSERYEFSRRVRTY